MSDAETPDASDEDGASRRRLLTLLGGVLLALLGAGFGGSNPLAGDDTEDTESEPDLSVQYTVTPDRSRPTPTPPPDSGGDGAGGVGGQTASPDSADVTTGASGPSSDDASVPDDSPPPVGDDNDDRTPSVGPTATAAPPPSTDLVASAIPPVSLTDVSPGDGGVVDLALSLSGSSARLWVRGDATDFDEGDVLEAERTDGDDGSPGELQEYVQVRLWYDADGDGDEGTGDRVIYEGPLAGLGAVSAWTPLTDFCVGPGTHTVRFRWDLPADAPNRVQTDSASFSLGVAADASECA